MDVIILSNEVLSYALKVLKYDENFWTTLICLNFVLSNSSIQLPGFCMPRMVRDVDGGSDSDGEDFEAVTPEHNVEDRDGEKTLVPAIEKRSHILEDVDGELEMEDVAPCCESAIASTSNIDGADHPSSNHLSDNHHEAPSTPQQPKDVAITSASLSSSTLPPPPPPHHTLAGSTFPHGVCNPVPNVPDSKPYSSRQVSFYSSKTTITATVLYK